MKEYITSDYGDLERDPDISLIRVDRNGTRYYVSHKCPKCGGTGNIWYYNHVEGGVCFFCIMHIFPSRRPIPAARRITTPPVCTTSAAVRVRRSTDGACTDRVRKTWRSSMPRSMRLPCAVALWRTTLSECIS